MTGPGDEPAMEQHITASSGGVVYAVQNGDQYVYIYRDSPPYRVEPFLAGSPPVSDPLVRRAPSWLLAAQHQVVPFHGRDDELVRLRDWRDTPARGVSVRLVHAAGGQGKTRLAAEFGASSARLGWTVAVGRHRSEAAAAGGADQQLAVYRQGILIIVDYAERWPLDDMIALLRQHHAVAATPARVLLLARPGGGWWQSLVYQLAKINLDDAEEWELAPLAEHTAERQAIYAAARERFADVLGLAVRTQEVRPDLGGPQFELVLHLHMKALVDVDAASRGGETINGAGSAGLSSYLLDREHDYWRAAHHSGKGPVRTSELAMALAVYTATLTGALPYPDAAAALTRAKIGETTAEPVGQVLADHVMLYPPADSRTCLEPLYPDRLGEDFIALTTTGHTGTGYTATHPWATDLPQLLLAGEEEQHPGYTRQAMNVLIEAARRWPHFAEGQLYPLLLSRPDLALAGGAAALTRLADLQHTGTVGVLEAIESHLPEGRHVDFDIGLADIAVRLTDHRLNQTSNLAQRAYLYCALAVRLIHAGRRDEANKAAMRGFVLYQQLGTASSTYEADFVGSLINLGGTLAEVGRQGEALVVLRGAVEIERRQAAATGHEPRLATALTSLSVLLSDLGRYEEAYSAAAQAVQLFRSVSGREPDLVHALTCLGPVLSRLGREEEALAAGQEAVVLCRRLATMNPAVYEADLAMSVITLSSVLSQVGRHNEALAPAQEAVEVYRRLAATSPAAFEPRLASALIQLSAALYNDGEREMALVTMRGAADIQESMASDNPAAHGRHLVTALAGLSEMLANLGREGAAVAVAEELVAAARWLAAADPAAFEADLAVALHDVSVDLSAIGRRQDAAAAAAEAVEVYRRLTAKNQTSFRPRLAKALCNLGSKLSGSGEALVVTDEAVAVYRSLIDANPGEHEDDLCEALCQFAWARSALVVELDEALSAAQESVAISRRLAERLPEAFAGTFVRANVAVAEVLDALGRSDEADEVWDRLEEGDPGSPSSEE